MKQLRIVTLTLCLHISFIHADKFDYYITQASLSGMSKLGEASAAAACYSAVESARSLSKGKIRKAAGHALESAAFGSMSVSCFIAPDCVQKQCWFEDKETNTLAIFSGLGAFFGFNIASIYVAGDEIAQDGVMMNLSKLIGLED